MEQEGEVSMQCPFCEFYPVHGHARSCAYWLLVLRVTRLEQVCADARRLEIEESGYPPEHPDITCSKKYLAIQLAANKGQSLVTGFEWQWDDVI